MSFFYDMLSKPTPITSGFHSLCHLVPDLHRPLKKVAWDRRLVLPYMKQYKTIPITSKLLNPANPLAGPRPLMEDAAIISFYYYNMQISTWDDTASNT